MKLASIILAWTPNLSQYPQGMRGKVRVFPAGTPADQLAPFPYRAGAVDAAAHDPRPEVRYAYILGVSLAFTTRDHFDVVETHNFLRAIDEYTQALEAADLVPEEAP
jgi:hypothetical protein